MAEPSTIVVVVDHDPKPPPKKRKRHSPAIPLPLTADQKLAQIQALTDELHSLFAYYRHLIAQRPHVVPASDLHSATLNGMVALSLEESDLPLSLLVDHIYAALDHHNKVAVTPASVKTAVLFVGQRVAYGVPSVDADVLEDQTPDSLWCWETRYLKLMPKSVRGTLKIRRLCRQKICDRITAVSSMINALKKSENDEDYKTNLVKTSEMVGKALTEAHIRSLLDGLLQKNDAELASKEAKREEKLLVKQLEKSKREAEKEKKRMDIELQKEKRQTEKEQKKLQEEAEKDEKRREKEESEMQRYLKKQQEEAERERRRREKEEAELKKQLSVQKQASIMERFLKRSKTTSPDQNKPTLTNTPATDSSTRDFPKVLEAATFLMDCTLSAQDDMRIDDIFKSHLSCWRHLGRSIRSNRKQHWSIRKKPKTELFKELKLTANKELACDDELGIEKVDDQWEEQTADDRLCHTNADCPSPSIKRCFRRKQLLQFDKSHRPAFFGIWPKKSRVIGPRHPLRQDPDLDYDVDSDEEWEEEDPGESLSDCDKDDEEETLEEGCSKADDEEESEDGFFVPDGYLSENEGVQVDRMEVDNSAEEARSLPSCKQDLETEEFYALLQQQKYLHKLTETALRKNQPLIISNLMHDKVSLLVVEDLTGTSKLEKICLQALSIRTFPGESPMEISVENKQAEDQNACPSNSKTSTTLTPTVTAIQDSDMPVVVSTIRSCSHSIGKVVESLQQKFPSVSKAQLRNKVREISEFVDNHWQVKKEILDKVGLPISPERSGRKMQSISSFFSKRCLPPGDKTIPSNETPLKPSAPAVQEQQGCNYSHT